MATGSFQRDELRELLVYLFPNNTAPAEETIDLLMIRATEIETSSLKVRGNKDGAVSRNELLETVLRYRDHIAEEKYLNGFFEEYDKDNSGTFDASELLALLKACAPEGLEVDAGDADYVLELCDSNHNGLIDRSELQPLIARWKVIAQERADEAREKSFKAERSSTTAWMLKDSAAPASPKAENAEAGSASSTPKVSPEDSDKSNATASPGTASPQKVKRTLSRQLSLAPGKLAKRASSVLSMLTPWRRTSNKRVSAAPPQPIALAIAAG